MRLKKTAIFGGMVIALVMMAPAFADPVDLDIKNADGTAMQGDPDHGEKIFHQCMVCHTIQEGVNHVGPSLHGVIGRTAGTAPGFNYSTANKSSGIVWTEQKIFDYLKNPQAMVPGTKMMFPGLIKEQDRADVIAYLAANAK